MTQEQTEQTITLELTITDANAVLGALGQLPYGQVAALINAIKQQAQSQLAPAPEAVPAEKAEDAA